MRNVSCLGGERCELASERALAVIEVGYSISSMALSGVREQEETRGSLAEVFT